MKIASSTRIGIRVMYLGSTSNKLKKKKNIEKEKYFVVVILKFLIANFVFSFNFPRL